MGGGSNVPPEQWGQPGPMGWMPGSLAENYFIRVTGGGQNVEFYHENYNEKPKKERRLFGITWRPRRKELLDSREMRELMGEVRETIIRRDDWRRDQGGAYVDRGGYGFPTEIIPPGPPIGFNHIPQANENPSWWQPGPL